MVNLDVGVGVARRPISDPAWTPLLFELLSDAALSRGAPRRRQETEWVLRFSHVVLDSTHHFFTRLTSIPSGTIIAFIRSKIDAARARTSRING